MTSYRSYWVLAIAAPAVLLPFLMFVWLGWPGGADSCTLTNPDGCFCEAFDPGAVHTGAGGVRQPSNTWFNLYALATAAVIAVQVAADRRRSSRAVFAPGVIPDVYVFVVLFLGLGSMWFHGSLKGWGGIVDAVSMYLFTAFLVAFAAFRLRRTTGIFWGVYLSVVAAATVAQVVIDRPGTSVVLVAAQVCAYLVLELLVWLRLRPQIPRGWLGGLWWFGAFACIAAAIVFWLLSQTGGPLCDPTSIWQPHGVAWHPLAGVTAVLLFYYWREAAQVTAR